MTIPAPIPNYVAATVPAKPVRVSNTTLFHIAMLQSNDPLQWVALARLNGITDPWVIAQRTVLVPPVFPTGEQTGILGL